MPLPLDPTFLRSVTRRNNAEINTIVIVRYLIVEDKDAFQDRLVNDVIKVSLFADELSKYCSTFYHVVCTHI